jgi:hypothetical protein
MAKALAQGTRAGVLPIFAEPQNTEELLEGQYVPRPDPRTGQFCSPLGFFRDSAVADLDQAVC